jgi:predicted amidohydrolase YtcJ
MEPTAGLTEQGLEARLFLDGATIYSPGAPARRSMLIEGPLGPQVCGKILAIGQKAADLYDPSRDIRRDLTGKFLFPTFGDGHAHPLFAGREASGPAVTDLGSLPEILAEIARYATAHPDGWIVGGAYEAAVIPGGDFEATWLDEVVADRPVVLHAADHHTIWVNSKALGIAGITAQTPDPDGGSIARFEDGSPKGTLREPQAMNLVLSKIPARTLDQEVEALAYASDRMLRQGITYTNDSWVEPGMAQVYLQAHKEKKLAIDFNISFLVNPENWREDSDRIVHERSLFDGIDSINASSVKFLADGALSSGTAALLDPYGDQPGFLGIKIWEDSELLAAAQHFDALGFQLHIHAIGDSAVRQALDVIETLSQSNPEWDRRPVIVHAQLISDQDLPRFAALGVIANMQPLWMYLDPMNKKLIAPRIGERNDLQYRMRTMISAGVPIAYGSDWPITSENPLLAIAVPVHRTEPGSSDLPWQGDQVITLEESWDFYTRQVAYQNFREEEVGQLEVGMRADFLIFGVNPFEIDPQEIHTLKIEAVYKAGVKIN